MSPTTSIPVFRISVAIGVTSKSSTSNRCWISRQCCEQTQRVPAIREWNRNSVRGNVRETVNGIHGEAFLRLFAIRNNLGAGSFTSRNGILNGEIVPAKAALLARCVRIGILAPLRSATAALEYFLWSRSASPQSKHSLNRCADLAANAQPRDEGIRFTSSLVLVWGKRCPAVAGRCLEHNEASRSAASSRRMISAVQHELFTKRRRLCPATTAADEAPSPLFISLFEGQLRHTQRRINSR
jgi:hypothetical protein